MTSIFRQINGFFGGSITATDNSKLLAFEDGRGAIADGTSADTPAPKLVLARQS